MVNAVADVVIVGGGIVGAACADELSAEGLRVLVLEAGVVAGGATAAGMGHIVVMDDSEAELALTAYSRDLWRERADGMPSACEVDPCGTLWIATDEGQQQAVQRKHDTYAAHGIESEILDAAAVAECEPNLRRPMAGALRVPGDAVIYPPSAACWLLGRARSRGVVVRERCRVDSISGREVRVAGERIPAGMVVNAAGAEAPRLTPSLPIVPRRGHLVITDRYPGFCRHQLVELGYLASAHEMTAESVAFNVQPRITGQLLIGSTRELVGWDSSINRRIVSMMLRRAIEYLPALSGLSAIRSWVGFRPATPDGLPLIGRMEEADGVWVAAGHEGLGISTSIATARILADLMLERPTAIDADPFSPQRVAGPVGGAG
jgi:D-hydroxyproline dehydrogenase subunit beta